MFRFSLFSLVFVFAISAKETICLNMIVKNEGPVIARCLDSVKDLIDYWVIVDTGSTDDTKQKIKDILREIPGELYDRPWKNFGESRSEAFDLARHKGDYILFMDADDILEIKDPNVFHDLTHGLYHMWRGIEGFSYLKPQLVSAELPWKWVGVTHEYLTADAPYTVATLEGVSYVSCEGGHRSKTAEKFWENVRLLEDGLKKEPENERYAFYLAESYRDAGEKAKALQWFQNRISRGGWDEEVFWSYFQVAQMLRELKLPFNLVKDAYLNAHAFRPHRPEPIYYLMEICNEEKEYELALTYLNHFETVEKPSEKDSLFNVDWIEDYGLMFQKSISLYYLDRYQEALDVCDELLSMDHLPEWCKGLTEQNRVFPLEKLEKEKV